MCVCVLESRTIDHKGYNTHDPIARHICNIIFFDNTHYARARCDIVLSINCCGSFISQLFSYLLFTLLGISIYYTTRVFLARTFSAQFVSTYYSGYTRRAIVIAPVADDHTPLPHPTYALSTHLQHRALTSSVLLCHHCFIITSILYVSGHHTLFLGA